jgi:hypothetical protein
MKNSDSIFDVLPKDNWATILSSACTELLKQRERITVCIFGRTGSGKSTLGKQIRKKGLPSIFPAKIALIDDGVLSAPLLGIFNRRIKILSATRDELAPFEPYLLKKKIIVYVSQLPERRISSCDVAVRVICNEDVRRSRLMSRNEDGEQRFLASVSGPDSTTITALRYFDFHS